MLINNVSRDNVIDENRFICSLKIAVLGSRDQLCINETVCKESNNVLKVCSEMTKTFEIIAVLFTGEHVPVSCVFEEMSLLQRI
jgi:hypothetical protein